MKLLSVMELLITVQNNKLRVKKHYLQATYKTKSFCLKCRKDTENINPRASNTSNGRKTILSKRAICGSKKSSRFIKDQEAKGL